MLIQRITLLFGFMGREEKVMNNEETEKRLKNTEDLLLRLVRLKETQIDTEEETFPSNNGGYQHITRMEYLELGRVESQ